MWRNYVICVLVGLLLAVSLSSATLLRQNATSQSEADRFRQRATAAEATQTSLQQQLDQLRSGTPLAVPIATASTAPQDTSAILRQIGTDVARIRGLQPKTEVPVHLLDQASLQRLYLNRFNQDYL